MSSASILVIYAYSAIWWALAIIYSTLAIDEYWVYFRFQLDVFFSLSIGEHCHWWVLLLLVSACTLALRELMRILVIRSMCSNQTHWWPLLSTLAIDAIFAIGTFIGFCSLKVLWLFMSTFQLLYRLISILTIEEYFGNWQVLVHLYKFSFS